MKITFGRGKFPLSQKEISALCDWRIHVQVSLPFQFCSCQRFLGELFANSFVEEKGPRAIERALDSSRYFIIRVEADDGFVLSSSH